MWHAKESEREESKEKFEAIYRQDIPDVPIVVVKSLTWEGGLPIYLIIRLNSRVESIGRSFH